MRRRSHFLGLLAVLPVAATMAAPGAKAAPAAPTASYTQAQLYNGAIPDEVVAASVAPGHSWTPEAATYGIGSIIDTPVTVADGTVLRVNVFYPTNPDGTAAAGPFPVLLTQTPYGKGTSSGGTGESATGGADSYLLSRGFIEVVADVRGTGDSGGDFGLFDPVQTTDGVSLVKYAAALPNSTHTVGLYGPSYLGINQLLTAGAVGPNSPVKAIFPLVASNDIYRDTAFMGGLIDTEFGLSYLGGITSGLNAANPVIDAAAGENSGAAQVITEHIKNVVAYNAAFSAGILADEDSAYDLDYWQAREPRNVLANIVANNIPAYLVGGEYDIFQRGEPLNFAGLQNAFAGRPVTAPMSASQPVTGRYQLLDGPFTHLVGSAPAIDPLELEWFDTWLKGEDTGMGTTPTPLHYFDLGTNSYAETTSYPFVGATPTRYYLGGKQTDTALSTNDGSLSTIPPAADATDTMVWAPAGNPCGRAIDQWGLGAYSYAAQSATVTSEPCVSDDQTTAAGPQALTYTTEPFVSAKTLEGPIAATIYATNLTTTDSQYVVEVEDVAADGTAKPLTEGALLGDQNAVDDSLSWKAPDGQYLLPYHPYTRASLTAVPAGSQARYDVEVFPTYSTIAAGHRIRITLSSVDSIHLQADSVQTPNLVGGIYQVSRGPAGLSSVELPLATGAAAVATTTTVVPQGAQTTSLSKAQTKAAAAHRVKRPAVKTARRPVQAPRGTLAYTGLPFEIPVAGLSLLIAAAATRRGRRRIRV